MFRPGEDRRTGANLCVNKKPDKEIRLTDGLLLIQHGNNGVIPPGQEDFTPAAFGGDPGRLSGFGGRNEGLLIVLAEPISAFPADNVKPLCGKVCEYGGMLFFYGHRSIPFGLAHAQYVAAEKIVQTNVYSYGLFRHLDLVGIANHVEGLKQDNGNIEFLGLTEKCVQSFNGGFLGFVCQSHGVVLSFTVFCFNPVMDQIAFRAAEAKRISVLISMNFDYFSVIRQYRTRTIRNGC
jgi:hypothetical protein